MYASLLSLSEIFEARIAREGKMSDVMRFLSLSKMQQAS